MTSDVLLALLLAVWLGGYMVGYGVKGWEQMRRYVRKVR